MSLLSKLSFFLFTGVLCITCMEVPSLRTTYLEGIAQYIQDDFDLNNFAAQKEKIKNFLEKLPQNLQEEVIERIDFDLCPQWEEIARFPIYANFHPQCLQIWDSYIACSNASYLIVRDNGNKITYQKDHEDEYDRQYSLNKIPNTSILVGLSPKTISFYSTYIPFPLLDQKNVAGKKSCVISTHENPLVFIAAGKSLFSLFPREEANCQELAELQIPIKNNNEILSLGLTSDNKFLYVGCAEKPSYKICLQTNKEEEIAKKKVERIAIAHDDSFFCTSNHRRTSIITKETEYKVAGVLLAIKNNRILTSEYNSLFYYDSQGQPLKKINIEDIEGFVYFIPNKGGLPYLRVYKELNSEELIKQIEDKVYVPEKLTMLSFDTMVYKLAIEKAIQAKRIDILEQLKNDQNTLSLFPQPELLRKRIVEHCELLNAEKIENELPMSHANLKLEWCTIL